MDALRRRLMLALTVISTGLLSHGAFAMDAPGSECRDIAGPKARLACFDKAFPKTPLNIVAPKPTPPTTAKPMNVDLKQMNVCDHRKIFSDITAAISPKTQFESTQEFTTRQSKQIQEASIKTENIFCDATPQHLIRYDADTKEVKIYVLGPKRSYVETDEGTYQGQNSFGASVLIKKSREETWELKMPHFPGDVLIPMPVEQAKVEMNDLRFGVVGDIVPPYVSDSTYNSTPTIQDPRSRTSLTHSLHYKPRVFILYNDKMKELRWSGAVNECKEYASSNDTRPKIGKC